MGRGDIWGFVIACLFTLSDGILMHNPGTQEFTPLPLNLTGVPFYIPALWWIFNLFPYAWLVKNTGRMSLNVKACLVGQ